MKFEVDMGQGLMSSGHLGMKWFCYMGMDRCSNFGDWIFARFRHSTPHSVVVSVTPRRRSCSRPAASRRSVVVARNSLASAASLPALLAACSCSEVARAASLWRIARASETV